MSTAQLLRVGWLLLGIALLLPFSAAAQGTGECPASVLLALARAGAACSRLENNQICYGNGVVQASFYPGAGDAALNQPGDIASAGVVQQITLGGDDDWSVASLQAQANLVDTQQRTVTFMMFGSVQLVNAVPPIPEMMISGTGEVNIRTAPRDDADIVGQVGVRGTLIANGRASDGNWLRVIVPNTGSLGWAARGVVTWDGDIAALNVVDETTPYHRPFQVFTVSTGADDALCDTAPESGLIIQTPNTFTPVDLTMNGVDLRMAATVFVQAQPGGLLTINALDGQVEVQANGAGQPVPVGSRVTLPLGSDNVVSGAPNHPEPYDPADLAALPINNLPYRFAVPAPLTQAEIDAILADLAVPHPTATPIPPTAVPQPCRRVMNRDESLYAGPGLFYEIINEMARGTRVDPVYQATDADGIVWWQLRNGNWVRANAVDSTGNCGPVPVTDVVQPPQSNVLILETCATENGPLRDGQTVTLRFTPPGFDTLEAAMNALSVDPGRITVDDSRLRVSASQPIRLTQESYIRVFSARWRATAGAHQIVGRRLSYIVTCNMTVPLG